MQRGSRNTLVTLVHYIFVVHTRVAAKSHFQSKCKHLNHRANKHSDGKRVFLGLQRRGCGHSLVTNRRGYRNNVLTVTLISFQSVMSISPD